MAEAATTILAPIDDLEGLVHLVPPQLWAFALADNQKAIPAIAKDPEASHAVEHAIHGYETHHQILQGDSRNLEAIPGASIALCLCSPPYWTLKRYPDSQGQLGHVAEYEMFLAELDRVWKYVYRVLIPGGRLIIVVGDVNLSRRQYGRHVVFPLHASIQEHCRHLGFDNLAPIIWQQN